MDLLAHLDLQEQKAHLAMLEHQVMMAVMVPRGREERRVKRVNLEPRDLLDMMDTQEEMDLEAAMVPEGPRGHKELEETLAQMVLLELMVCKVLQDTGVLMELLVSLE